jgi:hypothetical protein
VVASDTEGHLISILQELQEIHDTAWATNAVEITIERTTFTKIATTIQKAWKKVQAAAHAHQESAILYSLKCIQESITSLE